MEKLLESIDDGVCIAMLSGRRGTRAAVVAWSALGIAGALSISALYLTKCALGIDLLPGPSPLHHLLYPLMLRG